MKWLSAWRFGIMVVLVSLNFLSTTVTAAAPETRPSMIEQLLSKPFIKADFRKERILKVLSRPFLTEGKILFDEDRGVVWVTEKPVKDVVLITENAVRQLDTQGKLSSTINGSPVVEAISKMFLAIMSLDKSRILSVFDIESRDTGSTGFGLVLVPKEEGLRSFISRIHLTGNTRIEQIDVFEKSGDLTRLYISNEIRDRSQLSHDDKALLARL